MKKTQLYLVIGLVLVAVIAGFFFLKNKKTAAPEASTTPQRKVEQINQLPIKDRPFVTLTPRADGKEVTLSLDNVKDASKVEYEMEYTAGAMLQGVFGTIDFSQEVPPVEKQLLFGSCSKGKCKYDDNVTGGSLTLRFEGDDPYVLKSDFNLQLMSEREGVFTSKDAKASLDVGTSLSDSTYMIIHNTMGLPASLEGEVVAGPYAFLTAANSKLTKATLTIKSKDDLIGTKLMFYTGTAWTELTSTVVEGEISAPVTSLGTFVLVK